MYQALYRKYRPQVFDDVIGQKHITDTLKKQVETGHLSHAYIFIGTRGTGKTTCARILAKAINCENPIDGNPCCECESCKGIADGSVMDIVELDAASNNGVDNVRALREEAIFSPANVKKRVYIIDEVHMLSTAAFNALLKILEEPPEHLVFILATTELQKVPATILSRCQRHSFKRIENGELSSYLINIASKEGLTLTPNAASIISGLAEGSVRDALSMLDQCSIYKDIDDTQVYESVGLAGNVRIMSLFEKIMAKDAVSAIEELDSLWFDGKDISALLKELSSLCRDVLITKMAPQNASKIVYGGYGENKLKEYASKYSDSDLLRTLSELQSSIEALRDNMSPKTRAELTIVNLCLKTEEAYQKVVPVINTDVNQHSIKLQENITEKPSVQSIAETAKLSEIKTEMPVSKDSAVGNYPETVNIQTDSCTDEIDIWKKISDVLGPNFPHELKNAVPAVKCNINGNLLTLNVSGDFLVQRFSKSEIILKIESAARNIFGKDIKVKIVQAELTNGPTVRNLDELKVFEEINWR